MVQKQSKTHLASMLFLLLLLLLGVEGFGGLDGFFVIGVGFFLVLWFTG